MVNTKLERHFTGPHALLNEVSAFLYIYILIFIQDCYEFMYMFVCMYVNFVSFLLQRKVRWSCKRRWSYGVREIENRWWTIRARGREPVLNKKKERKHRRERRRQRILHRRCRQQQPPPADKIFKALESCRWNDRHLCPEKSLLLWKSKSPQHLIVLWL